MTEDVELLRRYAEGKSEPAFAELVQRRIGLVYSVALRQVGGDVHLAEDVTQKVFADLARKATQLCRRPVLSGWLCRSAQFAASDLVRAERRRRARETETELMHELSPEQDAAADWGKLRPLLDQALNELDDADRDALALRFFEGRSFADIGVAFRLTEDAARKRVTRALDRLHAQLARRGVTSTSGALAVALANQAGVAAPAGLAANVTGAALAAANGAAATALGVFQIMTTTKSVAGAVALITVLAVGTAGYQLHAKREIAATLDTERQAYGSRIAALRELNQRLRTEEQTVTQLQKTLDEGRVARSAGGAAAAKPAADYDPVAAGNEYMRRHPEIRQANDNAVRGENRFLYDRVFRSLGLSEAQIDEILKLHEWHYASTRDGKPFIEASEFALPKAERESRIRALLGESGYAQYAAAKAAIPGTYFTTKLAIALAFSDTPLTPPQAQQMIQLANANLNRRAGAKPEQQVNWEAVIAQSATVLSPNQQTMLRWLRVATEMPVPASQQTSAK